MQLPECEQLEAGITIDHLTRDEVRKIIEPDVNEEGLTIDQFIAEGSEDKLTDAHLRDLWLIYRPALVDR